MHTFRDETDVENPINEIKLNDEVYTFMVDTTVNAERIEGILLAVSRTSYERDEEFDYKCSGKLITIWGKDTHVAIGHIANAMPRNMSGNLTQKINEYLESSAIKSVVKDEASAEKTVEESDNKTKEKILTLSMNSSITTFSPKTPKTPKSSRSPETDKSLTVIPVFS